MRQTEFECLPSVEFVVRFIGMSGQNRVKVINNHFPRPLISPYWIASRAFSLACTAFSIYEVVRVACQLRSWFVNDATRADKGYPP